MTNRALFLALIWIVLSGFVSIQNDTTVTQTVTSVTRSGQIDTIGTSQNDYQKEHNTGTLKDFPRLHPMVVHFPIVFLLLAFIAQLLSLFFLKKELGFASLIFVILGFIGAYIAANIFHGGDPDPKILDAISRSNFEKHELYAYYTVWISGIAALLKIINQFIFKRNFFGEILITVLLVASTYTIIVTGDMGARLVHIDAIGVQGNKIPEHGD